MKKVVLKAEEEGKKTVIELGRIKKLMVYGNGMVVLLLLCLILFKL